MDMGDVDFEIFDEETTKKIQDEHERDMEQAATAIGAKGARRMGLITGDGQEATTPAAGKGLAGKLAAASSSMFSPWRKAPKVATATAPAPAAVPAPAPVPATAPVPKTATASSGGTSASKTQPSSVSLPQPPVAAKESPEAPAPTQGQERPLEEPANAVQPVTPPPASELGKGSPVLPLPDTPSVATGNPAAASGEQSAGKEQPSAGAEQPPPGTAEAAPTSVPSAVAVEAETLVATSLGSHVAVGGSKSTAVADQGVAAELVLPELKVVAFDVREPSLGAAVVGHVLFLEGSCYVWAGTEGSSAQGSLAAAVGTSFDGGMPTATPLLAGEGGGEAGAAAGGVSVSMAQRLCRRTGSVVFVSCDLSEDSQVLVAAVEAKVVALLKAEES